MPVTPVVGDSVARVSAVRVFPDDDAPLLVVTDVGARLIRRGLLPPTDAAGPWCRARVLVFRHGPVVCEPPPGARGLGSRCELSPLRPR
jgi:hypothetical protein